MIEFWVHHRMMRLAFLAWPDAARNDHMPCLCYTELNSQQYRIWLRGPEDELWINANILTVDTLEDGFLVYREGYQGTLDDALDQLPALLLEELL